MSMNKDFYNDLPGCVCEILEDFIKQFGKEEWFEKYKDFHNDLDIIAVS